MAYLMKWVGILRIAWANATMLVGILAFIWCNATMWMGIVGIAWCNVGELDRIGGICPGGWISELG